MLRILPLLIAASAAVLGACAEPRPAEPAELTQRAAAAPLEGAVILDWTPPRSRMDEKPLRTGEIAGYRVYIGREPGEYERSVTVTDPTQTAVTVRGLEAGESYYFAVSTLDKLGQESPKSGWIRQRADALENQQVAVPTLPREKRQGATAANP